MLQAVKDRGGVMSEDLLTPSAAARLLGKSEGSVRAYATTGKLPAITTTTGRRLFRRSDLEEFLRRMNEKSSTEAA